MASWLHVLVIATALGYGLVAGVFFAFSSFVMKALAARPPAEGIAAMQSINRVVINPWFLGVFVGVALASVVLGIVGLALWPDRAMWMIAAAALYLVGSFGVTVAANIPRNEALAKLEPGGTDSPAAWAGYVRSWTRWNHVRGAAALAACAVLIVALSSR